MKYNLILAKSKNNVIGKDNKIVWSKPNDMKIFRKYTTGNIIIMGRKTFESFGSKPLKNRLNIVLSRDNNYTKNINITGDDNLYGASDIDSLHTFLINRKEYIDSKVFVIGGAEIYNQYLDKYLGDIEHVYLTEINEYYDGDSFFEKNDIIEEHFVAEFYENLGDNCMLKIYTNKNISFDYSDISNYNFI